MDPGAYELANDVIRCTVTGHPGAGATRRIRAWDKVANMRRQPSSEALRGEEANDQSDSSGIKRKECIPQLPGKQRGSPEIQNKPQSAKVIESR